MAKIEPSDSEEEKEKSRYIKLPELKTKTKVTKYYKPKQKIINYQSPTHNSRLLKSQNESTVRKEKRICSVHCADKQSLSSQGRATKKDNSVTKKYKINTDKESKPIKIVVAKPRSKK